MTVRIGTFNCENLFRRFRFDDFTSEEAQRAIREGFTLDRKLVKAHLPAARAITGRALLEAEADVVALQEVENLDALRLFSRRSGVGPRPPAAGRSRPRASWRS